ncbi:MAG: lipopolysaccharide heptosyltransferase II [Fimbriiglobus sp.]
MNDGRGAILVFWPNWIGDVVMATPAIRALHEHFPNRPLIGVCKPYVAETLAGAPWFSQIIGLPKAKPWSSQFWRSLRELRATSPDMAVLFPNSFRVAALARLAGCNTVAGFARYGRDLLLSHRLYPARSQSGYQPTPMLDDYNRIVQALGTADPGKQMELFTTPADELAAEQALQKLRLTGYRRLIGLNPGGAFGASKHWPTEYFAQVARHFASEQSTAVVVLCGPSEREEAAKISDVAGLPNVVSLKDMPLSLGLTKALVRRLSLLLTTDSGPRHFAAAFDVPVVTLFGPTHIEWTETYFDKAIHLQKKLPCGPCQQRVCPEGHHRCMKELLPTEAIDVSLRLLRRFKDEPQEIRHAS